MMSSFNLLLFLIRSSFFLFFSQENFLSDLIGSLYEMQDAPFPNDQFKILFLSNSKNICKSSTKRSY